MLKNKIGRYIPERLENYFYIVSTGDIHSESNLQVNADNYRISTSNCFRTEEEAEKHRRILINTQRLKDLANRLNGGEEIDWNNNNCAKYYLYFDKINLGYRWHTSSSQMQGIVYCLNKKFLEKAKEEIGEEELIELIKGE